MRWGRSSRTRLRRARTSSERSTPRVRAARSPRRRPASTTWRSATTTPAISTTRARYTRCVELLRPPGDDEKLAKTLNNLASVLDHLEDHSAARAAWCEALMLDRRLQHHDSIASTLNNIGSSFERRNRLGAALLRYRQRSRSRSGSGTSASRSHLGNIALACAKLGRHDEVVEVRRRKVALCERLGDPSELRRLANALAADAMTPEAEACFARATAMFTDLGDRAGVADVAMDRALAWSWGGEHVRACALGEQAVAVRVELDDDVELAAALDNLGLVYGEGRRPRERGRADRALSRARRGHA
jgi:tetratricopeptide (TPR) repeat protein